MSFRSRLLVAALLVGVAMLVAAAWPDAARPTRHALRNAIRQVF